MTSHFAKLDGYFSKASINLVLHQKKKPSESGPQYKYRESLRNILTNTYRFSPKTSAIISELIRDKYFLGTSYQLENEIDDLIKDLITTLGEKKKV